MGVPVNGTLSALKEAGGSFMKYRAITALAGAAVIMAAVTGCSSQNEKETEVQTLVISDMDVIDEGGAGGNGNDAGGQTDEINIDLGDEFSTSAEADLENESETLAETLQMNVKQKPGGEETELPETETSAPEESSSQTEKTSEHQDGGSRKTTDKKNQDSDKKKNDSSTEKTGQSVPSEEQTGQTEPEGGSETEPVGETQPDGETESGSETQPDDETEAAEDESEAYGEGTENTFGELPALVFANDRVNVRETASTDGTIQALVTYGSRVLALKQEGDWMLVRYETEDGFEEGYIKNEYLTSTESLYTAKEVINVRAEADIDSEKLGEIAGGETVPVVDTQNGWSEIRYTVGEELTEAYVKSEFLEKPGESLEAEKERLMEASVEEQSETEAGTEAGTESEAETGAEPETEGGTEAGTEPGTEPETESGTEPGTETGSETMELSEGARGQFELARALYPEMDTVGMICSEGNKNAESQIAEYTELASEFGMELQTVEIAEEMDIDIAASELAGSTDGIFCIDDELVNGLVETIRAYADETGIPVFGISEQQAEQGCVAAYADGVLYWNTEEAGKLGVDYQAIQAGTIKEY